MKQRICRGAIVCCAAALGIAACSSTEPVRPAFDAQLARSVNDTATRAAVAKTGAKVCRQMQVGIAERDWVRGVVTSVSGDAIGVRIEDPGRFPQSLSGTLLARGALVQDSSAAWTSCRF